MFTGIVQAIGTISDSQRHDAGDASDVSLFVETGALDATSIGIGDSICVSGVCLTAVELSENGFRADVSAETLSKTTLGQRSDGGRVNLEPSLTPTTLLGGHLVSGHVDGIATVTAVEPEARSVRIEFEVPDALARYIAQKGSVCIDGVSLTVNDVSASRFGVNIVPHTAEVTTLGDLAPGDPVNIEVDQLARYLERLVECCTGPA